MRLALRGGAFGVVGIMVAATVAFGRSPAGSLLHLGDGGAWLANAHKGSVTHVNGLAAKADAGVRLTDAAGHRLKVVQDGGTVIVIDEVTGQVSRIDPAQLDVAESATYGAAGLQVVAGAGLAYVLDPRKGFVLRIDPHTLGVIGAPLALPAPLGRAGIDRAGTLWVPTPATGQVVPVRAGAQGTPVTVGAKHDVLLLTIAGGAPVVTDATSATMDLLATPGGAVQRALRLPRTVSAAHGSALRVPAQTSGAVVPAAVTGTGTVVVANVAGGSVSTVSLAGVAAADPLGEPQVEGARVYVPDEAAGAVLVYDTAADRFAGQIPLGGQPGPIELAVKDGLLWINDQSSAAAAVVNGAGQVRHVSKYATGVAGLQPPRHAQAAAPPIPSAPAGQPPGAGQGQGGSPGSGGGPGQGQGPPSTPATASTIATTTSSSSTTSSSTTSTTLVPLQAPGNPSATAGAGQIDVAFTPASGRTPDHYVLLDAPAGAAVTPAWVPPTGPFSFQVSGLDCATAYSFRVASVDSGGAATASVATAPTHPCVAPGAPTGLRLGVVEHGLNVSWSAPASDGGGPLTYTLSWNGPGSPVTVSGLSHAITGLTNQQTYTVTVTAANAAQPGAAATASATLTPPPRTYNNYNHYLQTVNVRSAPTTSATSLAQMPPVPTGTLGEALTVYCQVAGGSYSDTIDKSEHGNIWDKVNYHGTVGYVADIYINTPNSLKFTFSDPPLWNCN